MPSDPLEPQQITPALEHGIRQLSMAYASAVDRGDFRTVASLFMADGILRVGSGPPIAGRVAIEAYLETGAFMDDTSKPLPQVRHHVTTVHVHRSDPESFASVTYFLAVTASGLDHSGRYLDDVSTTPSGMRFARRRIRIDQAAPTSGAAADGAAPQDPRG